MIRVQSTFSGLVLERFSLELTVVSIYCGKWNTIPSNNRMNPPLIGLVVRKLQQFIWAWSSSLVQYCWCFWYASREETTAAWIPSSIAVRFLYPSFTSVSFLPYFLSQSNFYIPHLPLSLCHIPSLSFIVLLSQQFTVFCFLRVCTSLFLWIEIKR